MSAEMRQLPPRVLALALLAHIALSAFVNFVVFPGNYLDLPQRWGRGFLSGTLLANLGLLAVVGGILLVGGRVRVRDLGLRWRDALPAVYVLLAVWVGLQVAAATYAALGEGIRLAPCFASAAAARRSVGELLGQLLGNALYEEILFRGVLLAQLLLAGRLAGTPAWRALLVSQAVFALQHIPNRLAFGAWHGLTDAAVDLVQLLGSGLFFAGVYLRTRNLLVVVVVHALGNTPTLLCAAPIWLRAPVMLVAVLLLLWRGPRWFGRADARGLPPSA